MIFSVKTTMRIEYFGIFLAKSPYLRRSMGLSAQNDYYLLRNSELVLKLGFMEYNNQKTRSLKALEDFVNTPLETKLKRSCASNPEAEVLKLFHNVANTTPAYQAFLQENEINPESIKTFSDFQSLPLLTKENYIKKYPLKDLCRKGKINSCDFISVSSGSTGNPTFWTRFISDEYEIATRFEQIFCHSFNADQKNTLAVVCFTLGTWVGGIYTANCCRHLAAKGYPITVVTPGNNPTEIFRVIRELAPLFEQVILLGYPPFLKNVIDTGITKGITWQQFNIKLVMAGEVFSEEWRNLVGERIGGTNHYYDSASLYGTADAGVLGNETPLSICIRRFFAQNPNATREFFGESRLPTLVQYDPTSRYFEIEKRNLIFSGNNGIPLLRYNIADLGGIITYDEMLQYLASKNFSPITELGTTINQNIYPLPFVYVFGRSNFILSYYGANIYPENIQVGIEQPEVRNLVTGKFVMEIKQDKDHNSILTIAVELAPEIIATQELKNNIAACITTQLLHLNSEYANYVSPEYRTPQINLYSFGNTEYFPIGVKHRYTR